MHEHKQTKTNINKNTELYEERAILLSRISNHEKALEIYVHILKDNRMAEK